MTYDDFEKSISRTPITLMVMTLDFCGESFGVAPCTATGEPCYNTWHTCKDKANYNRQTKDYKFTSRDAALPFKTGERPYIEGQTYLPTEIKEKLTVSARMKVTLADEPDSDVGIDPYVSQRSSVQGSFWKKLLARNPNYKGRNVSIYQGYSGLVEGDFKERFKGNIDNISLGQGLVEVEVVDLLKSLASIEIPEKLDIKLVADITDAVTDITLTDVTGLDSPTGYIQIGKEIIYYTGVNTSQNTLTGCTRGYFSTTAAEHKANAKVQKVRYFAPANPFDILKEMLLTEAGIPAANVDSTAFDYWKDYPAVEVDFSAIISKPMKLDKLYWEIIDLLDLRSWVGEDLKITVSRLIPNQPGRNYHGLSDEANIVNGSSSADLNAGSRLSRIALYWDQNPVERDKEDASYNRRDIGIEVEAESANDYGESIEEKIYCRWLRSGYLQEEALARFIANLLARRIVEYRDPQPIVTLDVELKDSGILTGQYVQLSTDELLNPDGTPLDNAKFQTVKRGPNPERITLKLKRQMRNRVFFIGPNIDLDYANASDAQREYGFICDNDGLMTDGSPGYSIY